MTPPFFASRTKASNQVATIGNMESLRSGLQAGGDRRALNHSVRRWRQVGSAIDKAHSDRPANGGATDSLRHRSARVVHPGSQLRISDKLNERGGESVEVVGIEQETGLPCLTIPGTPPIVAMQIWRDHRQAGGWLRPLGFNSVRR